jgi:hypothetical protein
MEVNIISYPSSEIDGVVRVTQLYDRQQNIEAGPCPDAIKTIAPKLDKNHRPINGITDTIAVPNKYLHIREMQSTYSYSPNLKL